MPKLPHEEHQQILRRLDELHQQVRSVVSSQEPIDERLRKVVELNAEWMKEFRKLRGTD